MNRTPVMGIWVEIRVTVACFCRIGMSGDLLLRAKVTHEFHSTSKVGSCGSERKVFDVAKQPSQGERHCDPLFLRSALLTYSPLLMLPCSRGINNTGATSNKVTAGSNATHASKTQLFCPAQGSLRRPPLTAK